MLSCDHVRVEKRVGKLAGLGKSHLHVHALELVRMGADITVDNKFMGSTPSTIVLPTGDHTLVISKNAFYTWQREISLSGGTIKINAELVKLGH